MNVCVCEGQGIIVKQTHAGTFPPPPHAAMKISHFHLHDLVSLPLCVSLSPHAPPAQLSPSFLPLSLYPTPRSPVVKLNSTPKWKARAFSNEVGLILPSVVDTFISNLKVGECVYMRECVCVSVHACQSKSKY